MIYGYGRVSTKGQAKDGNSLEAQERLLKEHGAEIIYMDSFSGTKMTRPEFDKLLEKLKAGDTLVVAKLDRFARSVSQASDLITKLIDDQARIKGTYLEYVNHMARLDLLVIDDFGLMDLDLDKCRDFFEVIDSRDSQKSTIIVSQLPVKSWYDLFADNTYADACLDRMVHKAFRLELNGKNMRNPV